MPEHYDVIVIGTGAGGGTLAHTLAPSGKRVLLLERGNYLPRESENWDPGAVFINGRYISPDTSYDDFEPFYTKAEWLYQVHGNHGDDPTEGHWSKQYPWPAVSHEPRIQQLV